MRLRPVRNERDHAAALARIETLWDAPPGSAEADELEVIATLVDAYEQKSVEIVPPDPIDAILFRLEQTGQDRSDLQRILGVGRGRVSEILNRKRGLSLAMIRTLVAELGIPAEVLIQPTNRVA
jgi:HTH-type transcriptional regulator/antitoxin HigA